MCGKCMGKALLSTWERINRAPSFSEQAVRFTLWGIFVYYGYATKGKFWKKTEEMHKKIWISSFFFCDIALKYIITCSFFLKYRGCNL